MSKFKQVPLHVLGDQIVMLYAQAGYKVAISITVADMTGPTGEVTSTSNIEEKAEVELLRWIIDQRTAGQFDVEDPKGTVQ